MKTELLNNLWGNVCMRGMLSVFCVAAATVLTTFSVTPYAYAGDKVGSDTEILTNDTVIKLLGAGIGDAAVIAKIRTSTSTFDLSTDQLINLSSKGVPSAVIAAMLESSQTMNNPQELILSMDSPDPSIPHYTGVYLLNDAALGGKMSRINPTASNQAKTGGLFGYALTMGIASMSVKATVPGAQAQVKSHSARPVFYFYFDESIPRSAQGNGVSTWSNGIGTVASSPAELSLIQFDMKKDSREARVGSLNIAGAKSGVMDKDRIPFQSEFVSPGVFKVTPTIDLKSGEYGFIHALSGGPSMAGGGAMTARVFDFSMAR